MKIQLTHLYPDLMNLYGSYGNVAVLRRLLERLGHTVTVERIDPVRFGPAPVIPAEGGDPDSGGTDSPEKGDPDGGAADTGEQHPEDSGAESNAAILQRCDFLFLGAGTERRQRFAMRDLSQYAAALRQMAADGVPMLLTGTAMELLGRTVTTAEGETYAGVGLADFDTVQKTRRIVGDVYGKTDLFDAAMVGFMNKCGIVSGTETPLLTSLSLGFGNEAEHGPEGFHRWNVYGSELTGPVLVKNPRLLERIAAEILARKGAEIPAEWPVDPWAEKGYTVTEAALLRRCGEV